MATYTAAAYRRQPVLPRGAVQGVVFRYNEDHVWSVGDVILLCKVPDKVTLMDFLLRGTPHAGAGAAYGVTLYLTAGSESSSITLDTLRFSMSLSAATGTLSPVGSGGFTFPRVSLGDTASPGYAALKLQITSGPPGSATATASLSITGMILYSPYAES